MMQISRIGSQLSVPIKRGMGMRARALLGLGAFLFACGTDNADPMPSDGSTTSAPPSSTTAGSSGTESSSPSDSSASSATPVMEEAVTPGMAEAAPPGMEEAVTPTELVGNDGAGEGGGSTTPGTGDGTPEDPAGSEGDTVTPSAGCGTTRELMNGRRTIQSGGMNREYILRVPDDYDNTRPYRLILAYHWANGNANQVANGANPSTEDPYYGLWDLAENSTIFVAPEGLDGFTGLGWYNPDGRDVTLTDAILEEVMGDLCIDTTRIFATGFSFGASMSHALACARADVFRGVALYAGAQISGCEGGTTPIAYFHAHGVRDQVLDITAGRPVRDRYVALNGCTPQNPPEPPELSGTHICTSYEGCSEGHPVRWCAHGGDHNPTEKDQGQSESWVPGEAWAFISQF